MNYYYLFVNCAVIILNLFYTRKRVADIPQDQRGNKKSIEYVCVVVAVLVPTVCTVVNNNL